MVYEKLLRAQILKAQKRLKNLTDFFALSGSASVKAVSRTLMKLTPALTKAAYETLLKSTREKLFGLKLNCSPRKIITLKSGPLLRSNLRALI